MYYRFFFPLCFPIHFLILGNKVLNDPDIIMFYAQVAEPDKRQVVGVHQDTAFWLLIYHSEILKFLEKKKR